MKRHCDNEWEKINICLFSGVAICFSIERLMEITSSVEKQNTK